MKIDREALSRLCALDDDALWAVLVQITAGKGYTLPRATPPPQEMQKIRMLLGAPEKVDPGEALRLLRRYRGK